MSKPKIYIQNENLTSISKQLNQTDLLEGNLFIDSSGQARNYDSNIYEKTIINDLKFNSNSKFLKS